MISLITKSSMAASLSKIEISYEFEVGKTIPPLEGLLNSKMIFSILSTSESSINVTPKNKVSLVVPAGNEILGPVNPKV